MAETEAVYDEAEAGPVCRRSYRQRGPGAFGVLIGRTNGASEGDEGSERASNRRFTRS